MKRFYLLFVFFCLLRPGCSFGQHTFQQIYRAGSDQTPGILPTTDGGYLITADAWIRTNAVGDTLWTRHYNAGLCNAALQTNDGGYALAGYTYDAGAGSSDYFLTRMDSAGAIQWARTYGGLYYDEAYALQQTADSGFILAGNTWSFGAGGWDIYLIKTDKNGLLQWTRTIGGAGEDKAATVVQVGDGGYVVAGYTTSFGSAGPDAYLVKTDRNGNLLWSKTYNGPGGEFVASIRETTDQGFICTGQAVNFSTGTHDLLLMKTDSAGTPLWSRFFNLHNNFGNAIAQTADGGFIITGSTELSSANGNDVCLLKTNSQGDTLWTRAFGGDGDDAGTGVQQVNASEYVLVGLTGSFGGGYYLLKTDSLGNAGCNQWHITMGVSDSLVTEQIVNSTVGSGGTSLPFAPTRGFGSSIASLCSGGVGALSLSGEVRIYPNPSAGHFTIALMNPAGDRSFRILNLLGREVYAGKLENMPSLEIQLPDVPDGIYVVQIKRKDDILCRKILVERNAP